MNITIDARDRAIDRLDPNHLAQWRAHYRNLLSLYTVNSISRFDAAPGLQRLGYRGQALSVELLEFDRMRGRGRFAELDG